MKLKAILLSTAVFVVGTLTAGDSNWLSEVADSVNNVNSIVNGDKSVNETTIKDVKTSGNKYTNKKVKVSGKVVGLAVGTGDKFIITLADTDGTKINVNVSKEPRFRLMDSATARGTYNGDSIDGRVFKFGANDTI